MSSLSHRLVEVLVAGRVKAIFGVPGGQTLPLYGAAHDAGLLHVLMRDERGAACAADAYARASGHVGFCDATVGPGATNLVSGLAEAMSSSIPIVAIVADIRTTRSHLRRRAVVSQAVDQAAMLAPLVKWVGRVERGEALDAVLDQALRIATTGRPGPVVLEIPEDVFHEEPDPSQFRNFSEREFVYPRFRSAPTAGGLAAAVDLLSGAKRPLIMAGGGVTFSGAANAVSALAQEHQIPIVTSISGKGTIDERSPLAAGVTGRFGTARANAAAMAADVVLVIGCKLGQLSTHGWQLPGPGQTIIHIDVDGEEIGRTGPVALGIVADAREAASMLTTALRDTIAGRNWLGDVQPSLNDPRAASDGAVAPTRIAEVISAALREDDLLLCDASLASGWGAANTLVKKAGPNFIAPRGLAGIGWAGGAVIGARIRRKASWSSVAPQDSAVGDDGIRLAAEEEPVQFFGVRIPHLGQLGVRRRWRQELEVDRGKADLVQQKLRRLRVQGAHAGRIEVKRASRGDRQRVDGLDHQGRARGEPRVAKLEQLEHGGSRKVLDEPQTAHPAEAGCGQTAEMIERVRTLHLQPSLAGRRDAGDVGIDATSGDAVVAQLRQQLAAAAAEVHHAVIARAIVGARVQAVLQDRNVVPGLPLALLVRRTEATKKPHVVSIKTAIIARRDQRVPRRPFGLEDRQPLLASATLVAQGFNLFRRGDEGLSCAVGSSVDLVPVGLKLRLQIWPNQPTHEFLVGNDGGPNPPAMRLYRGFGGTRPLHPSILSLPPSVGQAAAQSARAPAATLIVHDTLGGVGP